MPGIRLNSLPGPCVAREATLFLAVTAHSKVIDVNSRRYGDRRAWQMWRRALLTSRLPPRELSPHLAIVATLAGFADLQRIVTEDPPCGARPGNRCVRSILVAPCPTARINAASTICPSWRTWPGQLEFTSAWSAEGVRSMAGKRWRTAAVAQKCRARSGISSIRSLRLGTCTRTSPGRETRAARRAWSARREADPQQADPRDLRRGAEGDGPRLIQSAGEERSAQVLVTSRTQAVTRGPSAARRQSDHRSAPSTDTSHGVPPDVSCQTPVHPACQPADLSSCPW